MLENRTITLYKMEGCPKCKLLTSLLDKNHVKYDVCMDVNTMLAKGFQEAPKLEIDGHLYSFKESVQIMNGKMEA